MKSTLAMSYSDSINWNYKLQNMKPLHTHSETSVEYKHVIILLTAKNTQGFNSQFTLTFLTINAKNPNTCYKKFQNHNDQKPCLLNLSSFKITLPLIQIAAL